MPPSSVWGCNETEHMGNCAAEVAAQQHFANVWQADWGSPGMQHQMLRNPLD